MEIIRTMPSGRLRFTLRRTFLNSVFVLLFLAAVIPNSLQLMTAIGMVLCFFLALPLVTWNVGLRRALFVYLLTVIVTVFYTIVGISSGAPFEAVIQTLIIYVISPVLWLVIAAGLAKTATDDQIISWFTKLGVFSVLSVGLFFFLYFSGGPRAVAFFKESANIYVNDGSSHATMFVYGSLIFFAGGFFAAPGIVRNRLTRFLLLGGLFAAVITSGRSALILSLPVGLILGLLLMPRVSNGVDRIGRSSVKASRGLLLAAVGVVPVVFFLDFYWGVNIGAVLDPFAEKILSGGGAARTRQAAALLGGVVDSNGLGAGHGIGVEYLRSGVFPWRYELVWLATLLRVGFVGAAVYSLLFVIYIVKFISGAKGGGVSELNVFMFSGFICAFIASNTNPYIEAFSFQWMYILPIVDFFVRRQPRRKFSLADV